jgi:hypothetical protein
MSLGDLTDPEAALRAITDPATELGVKPVTLYRYVSPTGELRENGRRVFHA